MHPISSIVELNLVELELNSMKYLIQFKLNLRIWIKFELNPTSMQVACNVIQYFDSNGT
jgi:hypothetical protein